VTSYLDLPRAKGSDVCLKLGKLRSAWGHGGTRDAHARNGALLRFRFIIAKTAIVSKPNIFCSSKYFAITAVMRAEMCVVGLDVKRPFVVVRF
jgi:hypothetical protein